MDAATSIKIVMIKRQLTQTTLAERLNTSQSNIGTQLKRNNFQISQLERIADALDCDLVIKLRMRDTGEEY